MEAKDAIVPAGANRSAAVYSVRRLGEDREFYLVLADHAEGTSMRAQLDRDGAEHLGRALLAAASTMDYRAD